MILEKTKQISRAIKTLAQRDPRLSINEIRIVVALERAIARLLNSKDLKEHLVFKGGFVLLKNYESLRFTRDALAVAISKDNLTKYVHLALAADLDDGIWF